MNHIDLAIIGCGPAGMSAAIQLKRFGFEPVVFEADQVGGLLRNANAVENFLGFPESPTGPKLIESFRTHFNRYSIALESERVDFLTFHDHDNAFFLRTAREEFTAKTVVVASGTTPKTLAQVIPQEIAEKILCEVHSIVRLEGKKVVIIGAGDAAFDYAQNLGRKNRVTVMMKNDQSRALPSLVKSAEQSDNISICRNMVLESISLGTNEPLSLTFRHQTQPCLVGADFLLVAIGRLPNKHFFSPELQAAERQLTEHRRMFLIGDVKNGSRRQASIAVGNGVEVAMEINELLKGK